MNTFKLYVVGLDNDVSAECSRSVEKFLNAFGRVTVSDKGNFFTLLKNPDKKETMEDLRSGIQSLINNKSHLIVGEALFESDFGGMQENIDNMIRKLLSE